VRSTDEVLLGKTGGRSLEGRSFGNKGFALAEARGKVRKSTSGGKGGSPASAKGKKKTWAREHRGRTAAGGGSENQTRRGKVPMQG